MKPLRPLEKIYWLRLALGVTAALVCIAYGVATQTISNQTFQSTVFFNGTSLALVVYLLSYYAIKSKFKNAVEKPQKLMTTGIGIYFLSWVVFWVLLYTIIAGR